MKKSVSVSQPLIDWAKELNLAITISDLEDNIIYMNDLSKKTFSNAKVGDNLAPCHSERAKQIIKDLKENDKSNSYTVLKGGVKKLIHQTPWHIEGKVAGLVEFSIVIPAEMPHHNRDTQK